MPSTLTLAPENDWVWHRGVSYLFEDLRRLPLADGVYDTIVCLSTLEHVGCDNSFYTDRLSPERAHPVDFAHRPDGNSRRDLVPPTIRPVGRSRVLTPAATASTSDGLPKS